MSKQRMSKVLMVAAAGCVGVLALGGTAHAVIAQDEPGNPDLSRPTDPWGHDPNVTGPNEPGNPDLSQPGNPNGDEDPGDADGPTGP
jgi:hypothetical protein